MDEKTKNIILIVLLVGVIVLGFMNISQNSRINNLDALLQSINNTLHNELWGLRSAQQDIADHIALINERAEEGAKLSFDEELVIDQYNEADASVDIAVSFGLKQFSADDTVTVTAHGSGGESFEAATTFPGTGLFHAAMTLPAKDNYTLSFTTAGTAITSGELPSFSLADTLCERFKYSFGTAQSESAVTLSPMFANDTGGDTALDVKELSFIVESGGTVVGTWDLLAEPQPFIEFALPAEDVATRLVIVDNMGIRYEQTDQIYISQAPDSAASGAVAYATTPPSFAADGGYGDGYIHFAP